MNNLQEFQEKFKPLLTAKFYAKNQYSRWEGFEFIAKELFYKNKPLKIIETGTLNSENDWLGYGQSTMIWDWIISRTKGVAYSVDTDLEKIRFGRSKCNQFNININFIHCDSMGYLRGVDAIGLDLLYLDSFNWSKEEHISSCIHHMGELAAIWDRLPSGCLIAIDDRHSDVEGKHALVDLFFSNIVKIQPLVKCHLIVWKKP